MAHLTLEQVAQMVDETRRRRRLQQDPYFYGAEERPGALLSDIDKLGLYGNVEGVTVPEADRIEGGSFQVRESIPSRFVPRDVLGFNDAGITQVPEDVSGVMSDRANALYHRGLDRVTVPHERYGGFDPATMTHEVGGHRGFNVMGRPMGDFEEHDVIYGQDPRDWARERVLKQYDEDTGRFVQREAWTSDPEKVARGEELDWTDPVRRQRRADRAFEEANQMARDYQAGLLAEQFEPTQSYSERGLIEHSEDEDHMEELFPKQIQGLIDTVTEPRTESGVGGFGAWKQRDWEPGIGGEGDTLRSFTYPTTASGVVEERQPSTLREAQAQNKDYYVQDGQRKLAITGDQLNRFKKSVYYEPDSKKSALTQWANIVETGGLRDQVWKSIKGTEPTKTIEGIKAQKPGNLKGNDKFLANWAKNYYTGEKQDDPKYLAKVKSRLKGTVPKDNKKTVSDAISSAVKIFGTDKMAKGGRMDKATMKKMLQDLGQIESGYRTRIAGGGRPERGFWQVLPSTAKDALENAKGYFGPKFNDKFAEYDGYAGLSKLSKKELSDLLEKDDALGAAFAAVQVLRTFDK